MELASYLAVVLAVVVAVSVGGGECGGHAGKHHDHVKIHMPEFIHHDHHTKVITVHHHHHKPKKEHHHHHHHHHHAKPHIPHHHYNHHHHKTTLKTTTVSKGHKHQGHGHHGHHATSGHHGHHHTHHGHHGSYGHHGHHDPSYDHDPPSVSYDPSPVTFEDEYKSFTPSGPVAIPHSPHVHGVVHTLKQVKVFDSLPGPLRGTAGGAGPSGYEVTEEGEEGNEDAFTSINAIQQAYPGTYGFVRSAAPSAFSGIENFSSGGQSDTFTSSIPVQGVLSNAHTPSEFTSAPVHSVPTGFDDPENSFIGNDVDSAALHPAELDDDTPVSYAREAGLQQTVSTGGIETVVY